MNPTARWARWKKPDHIIVARICATGRPTRRKFVEIGLPTGPFMTFAPAEDAGAASADIRSPTPRFVCPNVANSNFLRPPRRSARRSNCSPAKHVGQDLPREPRPLRPESKPGSTLAGQTLGYRLQLPGDAELSRSPSGRVGERRGGNLIVGHGYGEPAVDFRSARVLFRKRHRLFVGELVRQGPF